MRALLGYILALALVASPAMAGTNGPDDRGPAAGNDSSGASTVATSDPAAKPDTSSTKSELEELRALLESRANQLQEQNDQLKATEQKIDALEKQLKASSAASDAGTAPAAPATATATAPLAAATISAPAPNAPSGSTTVGGLVIPAESSSASVPAAESSSSTPAEPQALPAAKGVTTAALTNNDGNDPNVLPPTYGTNPEMPEPQATSPLSFRIGGAEFTPGGFMDLTNVFRTKAINGSIGTNFYSVPYKIAANYPEAGSTEDKFSAQNSRLSLRVDSNVAGGQVVGYVETDFLGNAAASLNTTSNAATLRMRIYIVDYTRGHFEFLAGQDWSMLTSNRNGIGFMPGDIFYTQDMDTNYQLGLVWERTPQFRFIYHANQDVALGVSMEDPDQYIGAGLTTPSGAANLSTQFDSTSGNTPNAPNLLPDIVAKAAYDHNINGQHIHVEVAGLARTFRVVNFSSSGGSESTSGSNVVNGPSNKVEGGAVALNSNWEIFKNFKIYQNAFWSDGGGRELANGAVPDFIVEPSTPNSTTGPYTLAPVHAGSFLGGFEYQATPKFMLYGYYGGVYVGRDVGEAIVPGAPPTITYYGWGIPTTSASTAEAQNRYMYEPTLGIIITAWRSPEYGALQLITQASYVERDPWVVVPGTPHVANDTMAWADVRYTLP